LLVKNFRFFLFVKIGHTKIAREMQVLLYILGCWVKKIEKKPIEISIKKIEIFAINLNLCQEITILSKTVATGDT